MAWLSNIAKNIINEKCLTNAIRRKRLFTRIQIHERKERNAFNEIYKKCFFKIKENFTSDLNIIKVQTKFLRVCSIRVPKRWCSEWKVVRRHHSGLCLLSHMFWQPFILLKCTRNRHNNATKAKRLSVWRLLNVTIVVCIYYCFCFSFNRCHLHKFNCFPKKKQKNKLFEHFQSIDHPTQIQTTRTYTTESSMFPANKKQNSLGFS